MADTEENRIPTGERGPVMEANVGNFELSDFQEEIEDLIRPEVENPDSNSLISSLLSSVSSTNIAPNLLAGERIPLPDVNNELNTELSFTNLPEAVTISIVGDVSLSGDSSNITIGITPFQNTTWSFLLPPNETTLPSASPWSSEEIGAVIIVSLVVPFILLSNVFVIISVARFRRLHTPTNYFITSLAAVDIFVALATPFGIMLELFNFGGAVKPEDAVVCLLPSRVLMMACGVSVLTLATIAYDRYTALVSPLEYINIMTSRKVAVLVSLTWIYSGIIVWLPVMAGWYDIPSVTAPCSSNLIQGKAPILFLSAIFVPSCVAIFVCYFRIFMVARHHAKAIAAVEFAVQRHLQVKFIIKDTKYAKTLALVIGVFLILWLPYLTFVFVKAVSSSSFSVWIQTYLVLLTVFNSGINPWIYAFKNNELRAAFKRLLREFCRNKLCQSIGRRASLVSAISGTPRLSRTDSRVASLVPEVTVYTINEKLKKTLDLLDDQIYDNRLCLYDNQQRRQTLSALAAASSARPSLKNSLRQAASCSNLDSVDAGRVHMAASVPRCSSFSAELNFTDGTLAHSGTGDHEVNNLYIELYPQEDTFSCSSACPGSDLNETSDYPCSSASRTLSSFSSPSIDLVVTPVPALTSSSQTSIYLQPPPPSTSSRRSSTSSHLLSSSHTLSPADNKHPPPVPAPTQYSLLSASDIFHTEEPHEVLTQPLPAQHLRHTYSLNYVQEAAPSVNSWTDTYCQEHLTDAIFHSYTHANQTSGPPVPDIVPTSANDQHILTHTQSCPIFDPIHSYNLRYPEILDSRITQAHLGKSNPHNNGLDFVSLVNREAEYSSNRRYFV